MNFWDKVSGVYDLAESINGKVYRELTEITGRLVPKGSSVLDAAAGTGSLSVAASRKADSVVCTDMSASMLRQARIKAALAGAENITFERRNIFDLKGADCTYDVVIAANVLHLLKEPQKAVRELCRVTKPGGRILLPVFMLGGNKSVLLTLYKSIGFDPEHDYTPSEYRAMLEGTGCGKVKMKSVKGMIPCCYAVIYKPEKD